MAFKNHKLLKTTFLLFKLGIKHNKACYIVLGCLLKPLYYVSLHGGLIGVEAADLQSILVNL